MEDQNTDLRHLTSDGGTVTATAGAPQATQTEKANLLFLERISSLPGVVSVEIDGGLTLAEQSFRVYLRRDDLETEYAIYGIKGEIYDRYPNARFYAEILEELGGKAYAALPVDQD